MNIKSNEHPNEVIYSYIARVLHRRHPQFFILSHSILTVGNLTSKNLVNMNVHEAGETNLLPMKSHVTIKYSLISMTSYSDFLWRRTEVRAYYGMGIYFS